MFSNEQINIDNLPTVDSVVFEPVSKTYLSILIINRVSVCIAICLALFSIKMVSSNNVISRYFWVFFFIVSFFFILNIIVTILGFSKRGYALRSQDIIYTKGLLVNNVTTVPFIRIQHIEISRSFIARKLNLATLNIYSAGNAGDDLSIKGLPFKVASKLNVHITNRLNE